MQALQTQFAAEVASEDPRNGEVTVLLVDKPFIEANEKDMLYMQCSFSTARFSKPQFRTQRSEHPLFAIFRGFASRQQAVMGDVERLLDSKRQKLRQSSIAQASASEDMRSVPEGSLVPVVGPTVKVPGLLITDYAFKVPLDHSGKEPGEINLFIREVVGSNNSASHRLPYLLYLQGGPGFEAPRPTESSGWIKSAVSSFRVLLMDQRGTGKSSAITTTSLPKIGDAVQQAKYLNFFRADSIVKDAELVRKGLVPKDCYGGRWSLLGQSFGGFCAATYLSFAPDALIEVLMTGGVPPRLHLPNTAEDVYRAVFPRLITQNQKYYARFPDDVALVQKIVSFLASQPDDGFRLPSGTLLTPRTLQTLGLSGLGSGGGLERMHYLLESFFDCSGDVNPTFIKQFETWQPWDTNPLYAIMQETLYGQGPNTAALWAAQRIRALPEYCELFDAVEAVKTKRPVYFTGEMVFPWMYEDFAELRPFKDTAELLESQRDWPMLYDIEVLKENQIPVAAAVYVDDMYVDYNLCQDSIKHIKGVRQWATNEFKHSGIRDDGGRIFDRLINIVRDSILQE
eukprot:gene4099-14200_t